MYFSNWIFFQWQYKGLVLKSGRKHNTYFTVGVFPCELRLCIVNKSAGAKHGECLPDFSMLHSGSGCNGNHMCNFLLMWTLLSGSHKFRQNNGTSPTTVVVPNVENIWLDITMCIILAYSGEYLLLLQGYQASRVDLQGFCWIVCERIWVYRNSQNCKSSINAKDNMIA